MGAPPRPDHRFPRRHHLRAEGRRSPQRLVHDRHQHRGLEILARQDRHPRARDRSPPARGPRRRNHPRLGHGPGLLQDRRRRHNLPRRTRPHPRPPVRRLQQPRLVQRRLRPHRAQFRRPQLALEPAIAASRIRRHRILQAPVLRLLHQLGERFPRLHPDSRQDRRHALQVGLQAPAQTCLPCADRPKLSPAAALPAAR